MKRCKGEREEEIGAQCILKGHPPAYKPMAAYLGAGPGETDSAQTIRTIKEELCITKVERIYLI